MPKDNIKYTSILPLRVVRSEDVVPHESIDPYRVDRLKNRLVKAATLKNPPIVTQLEDGRYMVLDGATRTSALKALNLPHMIVQVSSEELGLHLHTWYHIIKDIHPDELLNIIADVPNCTLKASSVDRADEDMFEYGAICYIHLTDGRVFLVGVPMGHNRLTVMNELTEAYINDPTSNVERTLEKNLAQLKSDIPNTSALVVFPEFTVGQVMGFTQSGRYFPAGITRFLINGRILRLNAPLDLLQNPDMSLQEKNDALHNILSAKLQNSEMRFYDESVYLLDE